MSDEMDDSEAAAMEVELHDPLAEDLKRLFDTWGLATVIHGVKCMAEAYLYDAEKRADFDEQKRLDGIVSKLDEAWVEAEGGER